MRINIPAILAGKGGYADAIIQDLAPAVKDLSKAIATGAQAAQKQYEYNNLVHYEDGPDGLKVEESRYHNEYWQKQDGSDPNAMENYELGLRDLRSSFVDRARKEAGDSVADLMDKRAQLRSQEYYVAADRINAKQFFNKSIESNMMRASQTAKSLSGHFDNPVFIQTALTESDMETESQRGVFGMHTDTVKLKRRAAIVENGMRIGLSDETMSPRIARAIVANPEYKNFLMSHIPADRVDGMNQVLSRGVNFASQTEGKGIGVEIFKMDQTGSLEAMTDAVRARGMDDIAEKAAIIQIKELWHERQTDKISRRDKAIDDANAVLTRIALNRKGLNLPSDLTTDQWQTLIENAPEYAAKLQDTMRRELDYQTKQGRVSAHERRLEQADNESAILISDDFATRDLKRDLAAGDISPTQYTKLLKAQERLDPIKRDSVRAALNKVNSGSALGKALGVKGNEESIWKLKYGDLVKAWAYNHADEPDFDRKMTEFVEKQILSDMVTSWFAGDESDRLEKYKTAKSISGDLPQRGKKQAAPKVNTLTQADLEYTARKHGLTVEQVKEKLGVR